MPHVYVSIGSNIEREKNIRAAIDALRRRFGPVTFSAVYESKAEGFDGDDFYNLVAAFDTNKSLVALRATLLDIERAQGRVRTRERYGPRTLDLDILLYGEAVRRDNGFDVPRREITEHAYILGPLAELAPHTRHPETGQRFIDLWEKHARKASLRRVVLDVHAHDR
jgi:2-amino-4-hydroxy-6-hydroxymethyldihydropteridine diphosphokinase